MWNSIGISAYTLTFNFAASILHDSKLKVFAVLASVVGGIVVFVFFFFFTKNLGMVIIVLRMVVSVG